MNIMELTKLHTYIKNPTNYIVDIGASTGIWYDPVYPFISNPKYKGLCIEGSSEKVIELRKNTTFDVCNQFIYPHNIIDIFRSYNVPTYLDVLKIDIDGFDLEVLRVILSHYRPRIIIAEINEKIPPPILFETKYQPNYSWDESHCFGFSVKSGEQVMNNFGYKILSIVDGGNILCVDSELRDILGENKPNDVDFLYRTQYVETNAYSNLPWNASINYWLNIKNPEILKNEIIHYFCNVNERSKFDIKTKKLDVDFSVDIAPGY